MVKKVNITPVQHLHGSVSAWQRYQTACCCAKVWSLWAATMAVDSSSCSTLSKPLLMQLHLSLCHQPHPIFIPISVMKIGVGVTIEHKTTQDSQYHTHHFRLFGYILHINYFVDTTLLHSSALFRVSSGDVQMYILNWHHLVIKHVP